MTDTVPTGADDRAILDLRAEGRVDEALVRLLDAYESRVYRLCVAFLRDSAWAEDVAQQSLIRIWKGLPGFDGRAALSTWIYAIVRNRCRTALDGRPPPMAADEVLAERADESPTDLSALDSAAHLRRFVEALPERYRVPVVLYYFEDESVEAVAERLGCPQGTVKTNLSRARAELKARFAAAGLGEWSSWH